MAHKTRKPTVEDPKTWSVKLPLLSRLSAKDKIILFKYLAVMIEAGIPLERALTTIHGQTRSMLLHRVLHIMITNVTSGEFFSTSLRKMPHLFDRTLVGLVEAGENSGTLAPALFRVSENLEKSHDLKTKVQAALLYPLVVILATSGVASYLLFFLLPQITPLFTSLNLTLPWTTRAVIAISAFLLAHWASLLLGIILFVAVLLVLIRKVSRVRYAVHAFLLYIPIFGGLTRKVQIAQMTRVIGTLVKSGLTVIEALKISAESVSNDVYRRILQEVSDAVQDGEGIGEQLAKHPTLFPPFIVQMISVGEETGKLDESFLFVSEFSEHEVDNGVKALTSILEPLLMLVIGAIVGFIAIAIITPIYGLTRGIQG